MRWFSNRYLNQAAVKDNIIMLILYNIAYPTSVIFSKLSITPNIITTLSVLFAILSFFALVLIKGYGVFLILWVVALHLDFCDGTVARMTNTTSKSAFNYDHMSDIFKISLIILGVGIRYNIALVWICSLTSMFLFLYFTIMNHDLSKYDKNNTRELEKLHKPSINKYNWLKSTINYLKSIPLFKGIIVIITSINGHTLLGFLLFPFGVTFAIIFLIYFSFISLYQIIIVFRKLSLITME